MEIRKKLESISEHKTTLNIGATFDIPTGYWFKGSYGESLLFGGLAPLTAIIGPGNMYKSTLLDYMMLSAMSKIWLAAKSTCITHDSETNKHLNRLKVFVSKFPEFGDTDIIDEEYWSVSDSSKYLANEWYEIVRTYMKDKRKNAKNFLVNLPLNGKDGKRVQEIVPTFSQIDSLSEMRTSSGEDIMDKNEIGENSGSHIFMKEGLAKAQMLHEIPSLGAASKHFFLSTAHIGSRNTMSSGPGTVPPRKQLQFLPVDIKIKGVPDQFLYSQHNLWYITNCVLLWNKDDKTTKYPKVQGGAIEEDKDLNLITVQHTRGKAGSSGFRLDVIVSQSEGILPSLTEYQLLKDFQFGFEGSNQIFSLNLMPDIKLQRTTVRQKLDENEKLRRAMNITSELCQMHLHQKSILGNLLLGPLDLKTKIEAAGYDWDFIFEHTRGWWTYDNEKVGKYFLSTLDLLNMAAGLYHPYWLESDKKTISKQFLRT